MGSPIIEVFIGLVFVYLLLSVVCSAVKEMISQALGMRAKNLHHGIARLLPDATTRQALEAGLTVADVIPRSETLEDLFVRKAIEAPPTPESEAAAD